MAVMGLGFAYSIAGSESAPVEMWPSFSLPAPVDKSHRHYLGLKRESTFSIEQVDAEFVLVQIFSMYCPICQREAPRMNQLYEALDSRDDLSRKLKIIGIGAGNSSYEVDFYRRNYGVQFPLFADGDYEIHQLLGEVGTPHFFLVRNSKRGPSRVVFQKSGGLKSSQAFLSLILKKAGLD